MRFYFHLFPRGTFFAFKDGIYGRDLRELNVVYGMGQKSNAGCVFEPLIVIVTLHSSRLSPVLSLQINIKLHNCGRNFTHFFPMRVGLSIDFNVLIHSRMLIFNNLERAPADASAHAII